MLHAAGAFNCVTAINDNRAPVRSPREELATVLVTANDPLQLVSDLIDIRTVGPVAGEAQGAGSAAEASVSLHAGNSRETRV